MADRDDLMSMVKAERARAESAEAEVRALREQLAVLRRHIGDASYNALLARAATADPTPHPETP